MLVQLYSPSIKKNANNPINTRDNAVISLKADAFQISKSINFGNINVPSLETMRYIAKRRKELAKRGIELTNLNQLDLDKIKDICAGIKVFEGLKANDIDLITHSMDSILLQRGCAHKCSHCGANSKNKITTIVWENFTDLVDGISILKKRLGFNPLKTASEDSENYIYAFHDSDPMIFKSKDSQGNYHSIFDAAKYYYEKTGTKFEITTAGWYNNLSQKAAKGFIEHPEYLSGFGISIHPFHRLLEKSTEYRKNGNIERAEELRNRYIDMMANVIKTTMPLKDKISYKIGLYYLANNKKKGYSKKDSQELLKEIFDKLRSENIDLSYFSHNGVKYMNVQALKVNPEGRALDNFFKNRTQEKSKAITISEIYYGSKFIDVDGNILLNTFPFIGSLKFKPVRMPLKFNFKHPTQWNT